MRSALGAHGSSCAARQLWSVTSVHHKPRAMTRLHKAGGAARRGRAGASMREGKLHSVDDSASIVKALTQRSAQRAAQHTADRQAGRQADSVWRSRRVLTRRRAAMTSTDCTSGCALSSLPRTQLHRLTSLTYPTDSRSSSSSSASSIPPHATDCSRATGRAAGGLRVVWQSGCSSERLSSSATLSSHSSCAVAGVAVSTAPTAVFEYACSIGRGGAARVSVGCRLRVCIGWRA